MMIATFERGTRRGIVVLGLVLLLSLCACSRTEPGPEIDGGHTDSSTVQDVSSETGDDPGADTDQEVGGEQDVDVVDHGEWAFDLPDWVSGHVNGCAPDEIRVPVEQPLTALEGGEEDPQPGRLWGRLSACEEFSIEDEPIHVSFRDLAMGRVGIDGEERDAVYAIAESVDYRFPQAVVVIDAQTGDVIRCQWIERKNGVNPYRPLIASSELGQNWLVSQTRASGPGVDPELEYTLNLQSYVGAERLYAYTLPWVSQLRSNVGLTSNGQILVNLGTRYLLSFDAFTGELIWVKTDAEVANEPGRWAIADLWMVGPGEVWALMAERVDGAGAGSSQRIAFFRVDHCGATEKVFDGPVEGRPMVLGDLLVYNENHGQGALRLIVRHRDGRLVHSEPSCGSLVQVGPERLACLRGRSNTEYTIVVFNLDGSERREFSVLHDPDLHYQSLGAFGWIAGANDTIIMGSTRRVAPGDPFEHAIHVVSIEDEEVVLTLPLVDEVGHSPNPQGVPVLSPSGVLVIATEGGLLAFQTGVPGLARTNYPRGPYRGGNENRGFVNTNP